MNKVLKRVSLIFVIFYAIYVAGVAIFLNTHLFNKVAGMENDDQTYVKFSGAVSLFPGFLFVTDGRVFISDQNVSIKIDVHHIWARFSFLPFLKKKILVDELHLENAKVDLGMKTIDESVKFQSKYVTPDDMNLQKRKEKVKEFEKSHLTLVFPNIKIDHISEVKSSLGLFKGDLALQGGFLIQPKVKVEVFHTVLKFISGEIEGQLTKVHGEARVNIESFRMIDAPGNAVFPYFNVDLNLDMNLSSLQKLDLSLKQLPGYFFDGKDAQIAIRTKVIKGRIEERSFVSITPSQLLVHAPGFTASGLGEMNWKVDAKDSSLVTVELSRVKVQHDSDTYMGGSLKKMGLRVRLLGTELVDAFHGIMVTLKLNKLIWKIQSQDTNPNLQYEGVVTGNGTLSGYSGKLTQAEKGITNDTTNLNLTIENLKLKTSFLSDILGTGKIKVFSRPINLSENSVHFPRINTDLNLELNKYGMVKTQAKFKNLEFHFFPQDAWKGEVEWQVDQTSPFVSALVDQKKMSGLLGTFARVHQMVLKLDVELERENSWLRFNEITSDGIWKAYGTLMNQKNGMHGAFEAKVLKIPIGIRILPEKTDVQLFPTARWYDEYQSALPRGAQ